MILKRIKKWELAISVLLIVIAVASIWRGRASFRGFPVYLWVEYCCLGIGIAIPIIGLYYRNPARNGNEHRLTTSTYICPNCEAAVDFREVGDHTCPKCKVQLEPLEGFYDRHPELKEKE